MRWFVKMIKDDEDHCLIAYSYEKNASCDGVLKYDRKDHDIAIEKMSDGATEFTTRWLFEHIHRLLRKNELNGSMKVVAIG